MPCYDKKLEASREDFYSDLYRTRDVDCVLTSGKVTSREFPLVIAMVTIDVDVLTFFSLLIAFLL